MREGTITFLLCLCLSVASISLINAQVPGRILFDLSYQTKEQIEELVIDTFIANECFDVFNVNINGQFGNNPSIGRFYEGSTCLGMESGLVITNGPAGEFQGGNSVTGAGGNLGLPGDANLSAIEDVYGGTIGGIPGGPGGDVATFDAGTVEFDFIPTSPEVSFTYVFASEEYCDYVGSRFNDKFGIFLSGPGINGPFTLFGESAINIAEFTDANGNVENVSINNINNAINPQEYVDNNTVQILNGLGACPTINPLNNPYTQLSQFDGWTKPQVASYSNLEICETYHVRIVVADGSDRIFGSAVFLQSSSFNAAQGATSPTDITFGDTGDIFTYESCGDSVARVQFNRGFDFGPGVEEFVEMPITMTGSAVWGLDYCTDTRSGFFPGGTVDVPIGGLVTDLIVKPDDLDEGVEFITITIANPCECEPESYQLAIIDVPPMLVDPLENDTACFNSTRTLELDGLEGGFPEVDRADPPATYEYVWSDENGVISTNPTHQVDVSDLGSHTFYVEVSDGCGAVYQDSVTYVTTGIPGAEIDGTYSVCDESPEAILNIAFQGLPPYRLSYTLDGVPQTPIIINDPNFEWIVDEIGEYEITEIQGIACIGTVAGLATVVEQSYELDVMPTPTLCPDTEDGMLMVNIINGSGTYEYAWSDDNNQDTEMAIGLAPGEYTVTVTDELGCTQEFTSEVEAAIEVEVTPELLNGTTCADANSGELSAASIGGTGNYTYEWFDNGGTSVGTGATISGLPSGMYEVVATDENDCPAMAMIEVPSDENTPDAVAVSATIDCNNLEVEIDTEGTSLGDEFEYIWTVNAGGGSVDSQPDEPIAVIGDPGSYELTVINTTNGCSATAPFEVIDNSEDPISDPGMPATINCNVTEVEIGGSNTTTGDDITYEWSVVLDNGDISTATDQNITASAAGTYSLLVTNNENGCTALQDVIISEDIEEPTVMLDEPAALTCANETQELTASGSSTGGNFTYTWSTLDGSIISDVSGQTVTVEDPGDYTLTIINNDNGCESTNNVSVILDAVLPDVVVSEPGNIDCIDLEVQLDGSGSESGDGIEYTWTDINGNVVGNAAVIMVNTAGEYTLEVNNTNTGCREFDMVTVEDITEDPIADAGDPGQLNCNTSDLPLGGPATSSGANFSYEWQIDLLGGGSMTENSQNINATAAGTYTLLVTNMDNGCTNMEQVTITEDFADPQVVIQDPQLLTCEADNQVLSSAGSSTGNFTYTWETQGGNIVSSINDQDVQIDDPGTYTLTIVNNDNGCEDTFSVEVESNELSPVVQIATPSDIDCDNTQVLLDGSGSDSGPGIEYTWTDENNTVVGNTASIQVDAGGQYVLEVNNTNTGCRENDPVMVVDLREDPVADPGVIQTINCANTTLMIGGDNTSTGSEFTYEWTLVGGNFSSNSPIVEITQPGEYILTVLNTTNQCSDEQSVVISEDILDPDINADVSGDITCDAPTQILESAGSSTGPEFEYLWTGPDDFSSALENPEITVAGEYTLLITNINNECAVSESVIVIEDAVFPEVNIETPGVVNCENTIIELSGMGSSEGLDIEYEWIATNGGVIEDDEDSLNPEISAAGTYTLTVYNLATGCSRSDDIEVSDNFEDPIAMVNADLTFGCQDDVLDITGSGSSTGPNITYSWTPTQGNISGPTDQLDSQIDQVGEYTLLVTNTENGCTAEATFRVIPDADLPQIFIEEPEEITCDRNEVLIDAGDSDTGGDLVYSWTLDDNPFTPSSDNSFMVSEPGTYTLTIEDTSNGCISMQSTVVAENTEAPEAEAGDAIVLNCRDMMLNLDAGDSSSGDDFTYEWATMAGGNIVSGEDTDEPLVDEAGTYILTVTNNLTGCQSTDEVAVTVDNIDPVIQFAEVQTLNCRDDVIMIDASNSDEGAEFEFEWDAQGTANIDSGEETLTPMIDEPGTYTLTIVNTTNGCESTMDVTVDQDVEEPTAIISEPEELNCLLTSVPLIGGGSSEGDEFSYTWSSLSLGGSLAGDVTNIDALAVEPGTYQLLVVNTENFCESTFVMDVSQDVEPPVAVTGAPQEVTCDNLEAVLSGAGSSTGSEFEYNWTAIGSGAIVAGDNTLTPTVNAPGDYELTVINTSNGCESTSIQFVSSNDVFPTDTPSEPAVLTCGVLETAIAGSGNPGLTYEWESSQGGNIIGVTNTSEITVDAPGLYTMTITDISNGCSTPYQIEVFEDIELPTVEAGPESILTCTETVVALEGEGSEGPNFRYEWTTDEGTFSGDTDDLEAFATAGGTYTLTIFNEDNECESSDFVVIDVDEDVPVGIDADAISPDCFGDPGAIEFTGIDGGVGPFDYSIDGGATFSQETIFDNLTPGESYTLFISDANGCVLEQEIAIPSVDSLSVQVANPMVEIDLGEEFDISASVFGIPESEIASVTWSPSEGLSCDDCLFPEATPGNNITYNVVVVSENGCMDEAEIQFRVNRNINVYIPNAFSPHNIDGVNDLFAPLGKPNLTATVRAFQIFDRWGNQVYQDQDFELNAIGKGWNGVYRNEKLQPGVFAYYVVLEFVDGSTELFEGDVTLMD